MRRVHQEAARNKVKNEKLAETDAAAAKSEHKSGEELKAELDELLDDIDEVLEENAEAFVANYVQKGGE